MFISVDFRARVIVSTCISHSAYFIFVESQYLLVIFACISHTFFMEFQGLLGIVACNSLIFGFLLWNSKVSWLFSLVFLDYSSEASMAHHRFYELSLFCQFGLTVFS